MAVVTAEGSGRVWPQLEAAHEQWVLVYAVLVGAISNTVINTGLGWLGARKESHIGLSGLSLAHPHLISQAVGTCFFLPFFTSLFITFAVRRAVAEEALTPLDCPSARWFQLLFPAGLLARSLRLGLLSLVVLGPVVAVVLDATVPHGTTRDAFLLVNTAASVVFGGLVTPIVAIAAMCDRADGPAVG